MCLPERASEPFTDRDPLRMAALRRREMPGRFSDAFTPGNVQVFPDFSAASQPMSADYTKPVPDLGALLATLIAGGMPRDDALSIRNRNWARGGGGPGLPPYEPYIR